MNSVSILIFAVSLILAKVFIWPWLSKYQPADGSSWKTMLGNDLPRALVSVAKISAVILVAILTAGAFGSLVDSVPSDSFLKLIVMAALLLICFLGLDSVLKSRMKNKERVPLWGIYGLIAVLLIHSKVPYLTLDANVFDFSIGVYLLVLIGLWLAVYWPQMQTFAALPIGFIIATAIVAYNRYLNTGEMYFDFTQPDWHIRVWPFMLFVICIVMLMAVFYKKIAWRRRWAYPVLYLIFLGYFIQSSMFIILLATDDISGARIVSAVKYNRTASLYTETMSLAVEQDMGKEHFTQQIKDYRQGLENGTVQKPAEAIKVIDANMKILEGIEKKRAEIYENRPKKISLESILWEKAKGLWQKYATPLIQKYI